MGSEMFKWVTDAPTSQDKIIKSNFTRTCNRFSQFLKERRSFGGELNAIVSPNFELKGAKEEEGATEKKSLDLFPMTTSSTPTCSEESTKNVAYSRETSKSTGDKPKKTMPSMTIFYGDKVLVFEDFPEDKAQEIMSLASRGTTTPPQNHIATQTRTQTQALTPQSNNPITLCPARGLSDFPIARINSLHRFMEKRKDRIAASAPYKAHKSSNSQHEKQNSMRKQQEEQQLELKL